MMKAKEGVIDFLNQILTVEHLNRLSSPSSSPTPSKSCTTPPHDPSYNPHHDTERFTIVLTLA
jgi:hypothetical protein